MNGNHLIAFKDQRDDEREKNEFIQIITLAQRTEQDIFPDQTGICVYIVLMNIY